MSNKRFAFGKNWKRYIKSVGADEIEAAKSSLQVATTGIDVARSSFLDIGSGSGLFSLAACKLGFNKVVSFDYDKDSVEATTILKNSSGADDNRWQVSQGSVLDGGFMTALGEHDLVYSWGVLHHTGAMWQAIENATATVKPGGKLFIAIYNDQGWISSVWKAIKLLYVSSPGFIKALMLLFFWIYFGTGLFLADIIRLRNPLARHIKDARGMKFFTDVIDWVGGYPFEVASPELIESKLAAKGFRLTWSRLVGRRLGCNEFLFTRKD